jgi:hypothetical protein
VRTLRSSCCTFHSLEIRVKIKPAHWEVLRPNWRDPLLEVPGNVCGMVYDVGFIAMMARGPRSGLAVPSTDTSGLLVKCTVKRLIACTYAVQLRPWTLMGTVTDRLGDELGRLQDRGTGGMAPPAMPRTTCVLAALRPSLRSLGSAASRAPPWPGRA